MSHTDSMTTGRRPLQPFAGRSVPAAPSGDDAELIALGARFEALVAELRNRLPHYNKRIELAYAWGERSGLHGDALLSAMGTMESVLGLDDRKIDLEPIDGELAEIQERARELTAGSLAALRTKVLIAAYWRTKPDEDTPEIDSLLGDLRTLCNVGPGFPGV